MSSSPSHKRQKTSASSASPSGQPSIVPPTEQPAASEPRSSTAHLSTVPPNPKKRRASDLDDAAPPAPNIKAAATSGTAAAGLPVVTSPASGSGSGLMSSPLEEGPRRKGRTNTPWTASEEQRLKTMRDAGNSWGEIAKAFPSRTEGSVKKHWYKDMHYAEFAEDESLALRDAIREYDANKWKVIGQKVGKPAKACEQYAKEHFRNM